MNINFSEEQKMIMDSARHFLKKECTSEFVRSMAQDSKGFTPRLWDGMAELGWMGLVVPEKYGGFQGEFLDLVLLLEEMGKVNLPGPFFSHVLLGEMCLLSAGNEEQKEHYLPLLSQGEVIMTLALNEPESIYDFNSIATRAVVQNNSIVITGKKLYVPDAESANYIICVARTGDFVSGSEDGLGVFILDRKSPGITLRELKTMAIDKQYEIVLDEVKVVSGCTLGENGKVRSWLEPILFKAALAKCAEMMGSGQRVLQLAVAHAKNREQFGKPIGSFQAIQHHCVNMLMDVETCRWMVYKAAWMMDEQKSCQMQCAMAKAWCNEAYKRVVNIGHQVMGGIGYAEEHELPLHFRRSRFAEPTFGGGDYHRQKIADQLLS